MRSYFLRIPMVQSQFDMSPPGVVLKQMEIGPMMNFVYLIGCSETLEAAVFDPAWDVSTILRIAQEADLRRHSVYQRVRSRGSAGRRSGKDVVELESQARFVG